jgi:hypothetical protein
MPLRIGTPAGGQQMNDQTRNAIFDGAFVVVLFYLYVGFFALHVASSYFFFDIYGFAAALVAFVCPVFATLAAIVLDMRNGNYRYLLMTLGFVSVPICIFLLLLLIEKVDAT